MAQQQEELGALRRELDQVREAHAAAQLQLEEERAGRRREQAQLRAAQEAALRLDSERGALRRELERWERQQPAARQGQPPGLDWLRGAAGAQRAGEESALLRRELDQLRAREAAAQQDNRRLREQLQQAEREQLQQAEQRRTQGAPVGQGLREAVRQLRQQVAEHTRGQSDRHDALLQRVGAMEQDTLRVRSETTRHVATLCGVVQEIREESVRYVAEEVARVSGQLQCFADAVCQEVAAARGSLTVFRPGAGANGPRDRGPSGAQRPDGGTPPPQGQVLPADVHADFVARISELMATMVADQDAQLQANAREWLERTQRAVTASASAVQQRCGPRRGAPRAEQGGAPDGAGAPVADPGREGMDYQEALEQIVHSVRGKCNADARAWWTMLAQQRSAEYSWLFLDQLCAGESAEANIEWILATHQDPEPLNVDHALLRPEHYAGFVARLCAGAVRPDAPHGDARMRYIHAACTALKSNHHAIEPDPFSCPPAEAEAVLRQLRPAHEHLFREGEWTRRIDQQLLLKARGGIQDCLERWERLAARGEASPTAR